jgi:hypothetical protein
MGRSIRAGKVVDESHKIGIAGIRVTGQGNLCRSRLLLFAGTRLEYY